MGYFTILRFKLVFAMNLFVAKLNPATTPKDLQKLFAHYGFVTSVKVIMDRFTGRSKSYGFVEMPNYDEAVEALKELDSTMFQESLIVVKNSQPKQEKSNMAPNQYHSSQTIKNWNQCGYIRDASSNSKFPQIQGLNGSYGYRGT
jgi:RNA recognition motif-containing protein